MRIETLDDFGTVVETSDVTESTENSAFCEVEDGHSGPVYRWTSETDGTVQLCEGHITESPFHRLTEQRPTSEARAWFEKKARPTEIKGFDLVDTNLWEFKAMIVPLWNNDGLNTPVEYSGSVFLLADGKTFALQYEG